MIAGDRMLQVLSLGAIQELWLFVFLPQCAVILYDTRSRHLYSFVKRAKILFNSQWDHFLRAPDDVGASQCLFLTVKCKLHCSLLCTKGQAGKDIMCHLLRNLFP